MPTGLLVFVTFRFDNRPAVWYKTRNCLSTGLVPRYRSARLKGKRVQLPRCPATVRGDRCRIMPLGKPGKARQRNDPRARKPAIPMPLGPPWNEGPKPDSIFIQVFSSPCPWRYYGRGFFHLSRLLKNSHLADVLESPFVTSACGLTLRAPSRSNFMSEIVRRSAATPPQGCLRVQRSAYF